jgi:hypothetical protein
MERQEMKALGFHFLTPMANIGAKELEKWKVESMFSFLATSFPYDDYCSQCPGR